MVGSKLRNRMLSAAILFALLFVLGSTPAHAAGYTLAAKPTALSFSWQIGSKQPRAQKIVLSDNSPNHEPLVLTADQTWLAVTPNSGSTTLTASVSIKTVGLAAGTYSGNIIINGSTEANTPFSVPVTLVVKSATVTPTPTPIPPPTPTPTPVPAPVPAPTVSTSSLPSGKVGSAYSVIATATGGVSPYNFTASGLAAGLTMSAAGAISGTPTQAGTFSVAVSVTDSTGAVSPSVTLSLTIAAATTGGYTLTPSPTALSFSWQVGAAAPSAQALTLRDNSPNSEPLTLTTDQSWLAVTPNSGGSTLNGSVSVNTAGLAAGTFSGNVIITGSTEANLPLRVPVTFVVKPATVTPPPAPAVTTSSLSSGNVGSAYSFTASATGGVSPYKWTSGGLAAGLAMSATGAISGTPTQAGTFNVILSVTDSTGVVSPSVTLPLTISAAATTAIYTLTPSPTALSFSWQIGAATPAAQAIMLRDNSPNSEPLTLTTDQSWLAVTPGSGGTTLYGSASVMTTGLAAGTYTGNIIINGSTMINSPVHIPVTFVVTTATAQPPVISTQPVSQTVTVGQTATFFTVATGSGPMNYQWQNASGAIGGATSASYTTPSTTMGNSGTQFTVTVTNSAGTVTSNAAALAVNSAAAGQLTASQSSVNFASVNVGGTSIVGVILTNSGSSSVTISNVSISGPGFGASGVPAGTILGAGQTATLNAAFTPSASGNATGTVTVTSNAANSPVTITLAGVGLAQVQHEVALTWNASTVAGYNVYRSLTSGGTYTKLTSPLDASNTYTDTAVQAGQTYFYEVTAVGSDGMESTYSNIVSVQVPTP